ncbi:uncharacterized protein LOC131928267 isoform X2 [Physella acuta]|uniref:uncharacterized protein LOC131928267 isoform X2 n=1 Tax=Physella acuta TaxID=109671 RepID=UPI0027DAC46E|nr:uncharacterized protein LOC131928267 isoform X2 [Physella acuta]
MCDELHLVTEQEIPQLLAWLEQELPQSYALYGVVRENTRLNWPGYQFYTIGWPNIQAAATGNTDLNCGCYDYFKTTAQLFLYARDAKSAQVLLTSPGIVDWNKPAIFRFPDTLTVGIREMFQSRFSYEPQELTFYTMMAQRDDVITSSQLPDDLIISPLEPKRDATIMNSTWPYKRKHSDKYMEQLVLRYPSCGVFDRSGQCLGHVVGTDQGTVGILYVVPEMRRHGLGQILLRGLSKAYFDLDLPCVAYCLTNNVQSIQLFEKVGYKKIDTIKVMYHTPT